MMINASSQPLVQVVSHLKRASSFLFANLGSWITAFEVMLHCVLKAFSLVPVDYWPQIFPAVRALGPNDLSSKSALVKTE